MQREQRVKKRSRRKRSYSMNALRFSNTLSSCKHYRKGRRRRGSTRYKDKRNYSLSMKEGRAKERKPLRKRTMRFRS